MPEFEGAERRAQYAQIARLEVQVERLEVDVAELRSDVKKVLSQLSEARGSWKTLLAIAGFAAALGAVASKLAGIFIK